MNSNQNVKQIVCRICKWECHLLADLDHNNQVCSVRPDPEKDDIRCLTGKYILDIVHNTERLRQPMQRLGQKGENKWRPIPWDEAIGIISNEYQRIIGKYGPESMFTCSGYNKPLVNAVIERFSNVLRLPNRLKTGNICHVPRVAAYESTFGFFPLNDINDKTQNILLWGLGVTISPKPISICSFFRACPS